MPSLELFSIRIPSAKIPIFLSVLATSFKRVFGLKRIYLYLFSRVEKFKE